MDWLCATGIAVADISYHLHYGKGYDFDVVAYIDHCRRAVEHAGGIIVRDTSADRLLVEHGRVAGAVVIDRDGETTVRAPWTLLATGGFSANPQLLECFVHRRAAAALARSNPHSRGDGMRLGVAAGAAISPFMKGFYGHVIQSPIRTWGPREFRAYTQGGSIRSIMVNRLGQRFCDESLGDHQNAQRILEQPDGRALLLFDEAVRRGRGADDPGRHGDADRQGPDRHRRGRACRPSPTAGRTSSGRQRPGASPPRQVSLPWRPTTARPRPGSRRPARRGHGTNDPTLRHPSTQSEGQSGVTATHGGLRVDTQARVLNANDRPIPGLLAAGADAGNAYGEGYAGGLAFAATFALLAAEHIVAGR